MTTRSALDGLRPEWEELFHASGTANPFVHPGWSLAWCDYFVEPTQIYVLAVRHLGQLVGVAPFYRRHLGFAGRAGSSHLRVFGAGRYGELTEVPGILVHPQWTRRVLRELLRHLLDEDLDWDWLEIPLGQDQGWVEPHWAQPNGRGRPATIIHKGTKPAVVMPLRDDWEATLAGLKRNVRQSIQRGRNRIGRAGPGWQLEVVGPDRLASFLDTLTHLHAARAAMSGKVRHPDLLANHRTRDFVGTAGADLLAGDHLLACILWVDRCAVAARLVFLAGDTMFFSLSGFDPSYWDENVATILFVECLRHGISRGATSANLGTGIDISKLRWSEDIQRNEDFVIVPPRIRSRVAFRAYWQFRGDRIHFD